MARHHQRTTLIFTAAAIASVSGLASSAHAQVAPPPPAPATEGETYVPPAPPPTMTREGRAQQAAQRAERQAKQLEQRQLQQQKPKVKRGIPNVKLPEITGVPTLLQKGADGKLKQWNAPLDFVALKFNAMVGDTKADQVKAVVFSRESRIEARVIENLDLYRSIQAGRMNEDAVTMESLALMTKQLEPLVEPSNLSTELYEQGALSAMQAAYNAKLVRDYKTEESIAIRLAEGSIQITSLFKFVMHDTMREPQFVHGLMAREGLTRLDKVLASAGLGGSEAAAALAKLVPADGARPSDDATAQAETVLLGLSEEQHTAYLAAVRSTRADENISEALDIELLGDGQRVEHGREIKVKAPNSNDWVTPDEYKAIKQKAKEAAGEG